jgi:hypothetical protein
MHVHERNELWICAFPIVRRQEKSMQFMINDRPYEAAVDKSEAARLHPDPNKKVRVEVPSGSSHWGLITGRMVLVPADRIVEVTEEEAVAMTGNGCRRLD